MACRCPRYSDPVSDSSVWMCMHTNTAHTNSILMDLDRNTSKEMGFPTSLDCIYQFSQHILNIYMNFSSIFTESGCSSDAAAPAGAENVHDPNYCSVQICLSGPHPVPSKLQTHLASKEESCSSPLLFPVITRMHSLVDLAENCALSLLWSYSIVWQLLSIATTVRRICSSYGVFYTR